MVTRITLVLATVMLSLPAAADPDSTDGAIRENAVTLLGTAKAIARVCGRSIYNEDVAAEIMFAAGLTPDSEWDQAEIEAEHNVYLNTRPLSDTRQYYCDLGRELFGRDGTAAPNLIRF